MTKTAKRAPGRHQAIARFSDEHFRAAREALAGAERLLVLFEERHPDDPRPREAIAGLRDWVEAGRPLGMKEVRRLSLGAHAAAREATTDAARFAARAIGHAIATWHVPTHAEGVPYYGAKALAAKTKESGDGAVTPPERIRNISDR